MAAPKDNEFWKLRSKHGRDKLFASPELLWEAACEYFHWAQNSPLMEAEQAKGNPRAFEDSAGRVHWPPNLIDLPKMRPFTLQGLCRYLDCNTVYFNQFIPPNDDFSKIVTRIRETIYEQKFTGAAAGFLNPNIIARDLGLTDKKEHNLSLQSQLEGLTDDDLMKLAQKIVNQKSSTT